MYAHGRPGARCKCATWLNTIAQVCTRSRKVSWVADERPLAAECAAPASALKDAVTATLQAVTKLKGHVELVAPGTLPNDGKVIADERSYP